MGLIRKLVYKLYITGHNMEEERKFQKMMSSFKSFGEGSFIQNPLVVWNAENISVGKNSRLLDGVRIQCQKYDDLGQGYIEIGDGTGIGYNVGILAGAGATIKIGNGVAVAGNSFFSNGNHGMNPEDTQPYGDTPYIAKGDLIIGDRAWIGERCCVIGAVSVGEGSIVGAGSVVTKDIPPYSIAVGNPARVIKKYDFEKHEWVKA